MSTLQAMWLGAMLAWTPSLVVLAAGWSWPAALDLESKFNETGLSTVVCTDQLSRRNFSDEDRVGLFFSHAVVHLIDLLERKTRSEIFDRIEFAFGAK